MDFPIKNGDFPLLCQITRGYTHFQTQLSTYSTSYSWYWVAEATEEVAERGRQLKAEAGKRRVNPDRKQLREEVAQQRSISPIHSFALYEYEIWWNLKIRQLQMIKIDETIYHNKDHVKTMPKRKQVMNKMKMDEHKKWKKNKDTMMKVDETKNGRKKTDEHQSRKWKK